MNALWAGLPVLTCLGRTFASRVAGSLLHTIEMPELAAGNPQSYEALKLEFARDPDLLAAIRDKLARTHDTMPLFDRKRLDRDLESAYMTMLERWRAGDALQPFAVNSQAG